jgi:hypothetical protein
MLASGVEVCRFLRRRQPRSGGAGGFQPPPVPSDRAGGIRGCVWLGRWKALEGGRKRLERGVGRRARDALLRGGCLPAFQPLAQRMRLELSEAEKFVLTTFRM